MRAVRDTMETLCRENDALQMQTSAMGAQIAGLEATNAGLEATNAETRAEMSELRAQMAQMRSLLNTLAASQGTHCDHWVPVTSRLTHYVNLTTLSRFECLLRRPFVGYMHSVTLSICSAVYGDVGSVRTMAKVYPRLNVLSTGG